MTLLFSGADLNIAFKNVEGNAEAEIRNFGDDYVLAHTIEDLTESVYEKYAIKAPVLDKDAIGSDWVDGYVPEYRTPNPNFDQQPGVKGRIYSLHVPYTGDEYLRAMTIRYRAEESTDHTESVDGGAADYACR